MIAIELGPLSAPSAPLSMPSEDALLGVLDAGEREQLSALLRKVTIAAEAADPETAE